ncbi:cytochrome c oxidase assembly protein [Alicyclobacillus tolerans]|uniref:cytochrome c oxidase assembly protein n=1 Tax=Alicyclobacillus tolerans TaxID=90970 RepID=UPI001F3230C7|nr:cytochrome c oxidase assembly protein [Alicyclobacillus tolerans]MCF8567549.1 cytochrome c oxidase assembly protein [Alicyclobacillus tolerans]
MQALVQHSSWLLFWRPDVALAVLLVGASYFALVGPLRVHVRNSEPATFGQAMAAGTALMVLYAAMGPLGWISQQFLFTAYVLQMLLITQVVPPLLYLALPDWFVEPITTCSVLRAFLKAACSPVAAPVTYNALATVFLLPSPLSAVLSNDLVHFVVQSSLLVSAVFMWWPLMSRVKTMPRLTPGAQLVYLLFAANFMMPIAVFLFFSQTPWYPIYTQGDALLGVPPLGDQQIGALLMAVGMLFIYALRAIRPFFSHSDSVWYQ